MQLALLLSVTVWFGGGDGDPQAAVKEVFETYEYQRDLFPQLRRSAGTSSGGESRDSRSGDGEGGRWSPDDFHRDMKANDPRYRRLPDRLGSRDRRRPPPERSERSDRGGGAGLGDILKILVFVALGIALITILLSVLRNWGSKEATVSAKVTDGAAAPQAKLDAPRSEAEALADEGRFDEAVHVLLLKTIEALMKAQPGGVPEAWTSREIQRDAPMPERARSPFGTLVDTVENSLFGGVPVDRAAWEACLERFHEFEAAYRARTA